MNRNVFWKKYLYVSVGFVLIVVFVLTLTFVKFFSLEQKRLIESNAEDVLYFAENSLLQRLNKIEDVLGGNGMARNFVAARENDEKKLTGDHEYSTKMLIDSIYADNCDIVAIFYSDDNGRYSVGENLVSIDNKLEIIENARKSESFKRDKYVWFYDKLKNGVDTCVLYREIVYVDNGYMKHKLGDILVYVDLSQITEKYFENKNEDVGVFFLDDSGTIAVSTNKKIIGENFYDYFQVKNTSFFSADDRYYYFETNMGNTSWKKIRFYKHGYLNVQLWEAISWLIIIVFICVIIMMLVIYRITRGITRPVEELFSYIKVSDKGDIIVENGAYNDEIEEIKQIFDKVVDELKRQLFNNYEKEIELKNAMIKAQEFQMNPHFLYNTLQMIQMLNATGKKDDVNNAITYLGKMLRFNLKFENDVTLKEEIWNVENYFSILKYRFRDKFDYKIFIDEELYDCNVIKFLLQPFVENSVNHGFKNKMDLWEIAISVVKINDELAVIVRDNGSGIEKQRLYEIKNGLMNDEREGTGVGIRNVNSRIKLNYGKQYGVDIFSYKGSTQVIIHIPYIHREGEDNCV